VGKSRGGGKMRIEKINKMIYFMKLYCKTTFNFLCSLINIAVVGMVLFGSTASIILLYKLFPSVGIIFISLISKFYNIFDALFTITVTMFVVFSTSLVMFLIAKRFKKNRIIVEQENKKWIKQIATEVNKINKRGKK